MEHPACFEDVHALIFRLYAEGLIDGVRVDHVDGLADPAQYCRALRARLDALTGERPDGAPRDRAYIVVEKILLRGETLPAAWDCDGTSGYDFMNDVSAVQHDARGEAPLGALWQSVSGRSADFAREEQAARREIIARSFSAQLDACAASFHRARARRRRGDRAARRCAARSSSCSRISRSIAPMRRPMSGRRATRRSSRPPRAARRQHVFPPTARRSIGCIVGSATQRRRARRDPGARRHPVPAAQRAGRRQGGRGHGVLSLRAPALAQRCRLRRRRASATAPADFHAHVRRRQADFPHAMLATATHDHKRGEDVRARLAVLSEYADDWAAAVPRWIAQCAPLRAAALPHPATSPCCCR